MVPLSRFRECISSAVVELERCLGMVGCGMALSGAWNPGYKGTLGAETPVSLTSRVLFLPMVELLGYGRPEFDGDMERVPGTAMAMVPMNRPLDTALRSMMTHLRCSEDITCIVTDGVVWILIVRGQQGPKVDSVHDLRGYYMHALDEHRFRTGISMDFSSAEVFLGRLDASRRT